MTMIGAMRKGFLGSWVGEAALTPEHRISVTYVAEPDNVPIAEIERAVREVLERVARDEWNLRLRAAQAWLAGFHGALPQTRAWDAERLARSFTLRDVILGNSDPTFILEYATTLPVDKHPKAWFKPDGSFSHISGHLDQETR